MISHVSGKLTKRNESRLSVEVNVNGIGYELLLPSFVWRAVEEAPIGEEIEFETFYHATERQPAPVLFGFQREVEREFFKKLIEVPDLGPSKAMKLLVLSISTIATWIEQGDEKELRKLPGVGERLAKTMVAHLRGRVVEEALLQDEGFAAPPAEKGPPPLTEAKKLAIEGLTKLGYKQVEAARWVEQVTAENDSESPEEIIRAVFGLRNSVL